MHRLFYLLGILPGSFFMPINAHNCIINALKKL